jgi:hypothetical protein
MTTRAELRNTVRERLEDASGSPLWSDAALNDYLATAVRAYGVAFPRPATAATAGLALGVVAVALPAGVFETGIVAVRDSRGRDVPPMSERQGPDPLDATGLVQGWKVWGGQQWLQRPVACDEAGAWAIDYLGGRELAGDDGSQQPIESGDEPIVVALAAAQALERRAIEDAKRGTRASAIDAAAAAFRDEALALMAGRKRRVRSGSLVTA